MENQNRVNSANKDEFYPPHPTRWTLFWRTCFIYQIYIFFRLNLKIMMIVVKGHS